MNDRFKFRVWYKSENEMIYDAESTYDNGCQNKGSFHHWNFGEVLEDEDCVVMQCTGLKDKNGKLIYEGDVVKIYPFEYIGKIVFENYAYLLVSNLKYLGSQKFPLVEIKKMKLEVIGNIYEIPELLKECE